MHGSTQLTTEKICANGWCKASFKVTDDDLAFYAKFSAAAPELANLPLPTLCPDCRQQRRLARRNERSYYKRPCDLCKKEMITMYAPEAPFPVYCYLCWWSDNWDPLEYGRDFDDTRPFFQQFQELQDVVPRISLYGKNNENCEYINHSVDSKNCYLCVDVVSQDVYYSKWAIHCADSCDCYQIEKSERCYESQYSVNVHDCIYGFLCYTSSNLAFCYDCKDCHDCFLCAHLRSKRFCIENEQLTEEEYRKRMKEWDFKSSKTFDRAVQKYQELWRKTFHRDQQVISSEDSSGDYLDHCKNVHDSYGVVESQDCRYCYDSLGIKDCYDAYEPAFHSELQYDSHGCNDGKRLIGCHICYNNDALAYCDFCHNASQLVGCIGMRRKQYCILNKQHTKEEYSKLLPQIIAHMQKTGEWGEFFPMQLSPFGYNETAAQEYYPSSKKDIVERGWKWREQADEFPAVTKTIPGDRLPDSIEDVPDDILHWAITCTVTGRPFKIIKQELAFCRTMRIPVPRLHPDERHKRRMAFTNPRKLWTRKCDQCGKGIETTYAPERPEIVYCEECYLKTVY